MFEGEEAGYCTSVSILLQSLSYKVLPCTKAGEG